MGSVVVVAGRLSRDFWLYFTGQSVSSLGSSFTQFALPLVIFQLTGSATSLGAGNAIQFLPYLLFGLVIGALVDRLDRRRMLITTDLGRAVLIAVVPTLALLGVLSVVWIYVVVFCQSTLRVFFDAGQFAGVANLVGKEQLVKANGRIQASLSSMRIVGPLLAGLLIEIAPVTDVLYVDAASFAVSALSLSLIHISFNEIAAKKHPGAGQRGMALVRALRGEIGAGLRYVFANPVLRNISIMSAVVNLFFTTVSAQLVFFAHVRLHATASQVGYLYAAGAAGVVLLSFAASPLRRRLRFSVVALGALFAEGLTTLGLGLTGNYVAALALWAGTNGLGILFNIQTISLRQQIVPDELLGRVISIASVLGWSVIPLGSLVGGFIISGTGNIGGVYVVIGAVIAFVALVFSRTALGRADRHLGPTAKPAIAT